MSFGEEIPLDVACQTQLVVFFKEITNIFKLLVFHVSVSSDSVKKGAGKLAYGVEIRMI